MSLTRLNNRKLTLTWTKTVDCCLLTVDIKKRDNRDISVVFFCWRVFK